MEESGEVLFRGPRLHDVLAAGETGERRENGPAVRARRIRRGIPLATVAEDGWVLASRQAATHSGSAICSLYTVRPLAAGKKTDEEDAKWVFSLLHRADALTFRTGL